MKTTSVLTCTLQAEIEELKDQIEKEKLKVSKEKDEQLQKLRDY